MIHDPFLRHQVGADALVEGFYLIRRPISGRIDVPVRIWFGPPLDPDREPGDVDLPEELDRAPRWQIQIAGALLTDEPLYIGDVRIEELADFWPSCGKNPIDREEYERRIAVQKWAIEWSPEDPYATPGSRVDPMTMPLPFLD